MLDKLLGVSLEIDARNKTGIHAYHWPSRDVLVEINCSKTISDSPSPSGLQPTEEEISSASSTASGIFSMRSSRTDSLESSLTSPSTVPSDTSSMTSSPVSPSLKEVLRCDEGTCTATFTGEFRFTNLRRHKRTAKIHNDTPMFACTEPGCKRLIGRSDNMRKHFQTFHPLSVCPTMTRQGTKKLKKLAVDVPGREPLPMEMVLDDRQMESK